MYAQKLKVDDLEYLKGSYKPVTAYARTKRMQVVLAEEWAKRLPGSVVHAVHPGWVDTPGIADGLPGFRKLTGRNPAHAGAGRRHYGVARRGAGAGGEHGPLVARPRGAPGALHAPHPRVRGGPSRAVERGRSDVRGVCLHAAADVSRQASRGRRSSRADARGGGAQGAGGAAARTCAGRRWPTPPAKAAPRDHGAARAGAHDDEHAHRAAGGHARARGLDPRDRACCIRRWCARRARRSSRTSCSPASAGSPRCS